MKAYYHASYGDPYHQQPCRGTHELSGTRHQGWYCALGRYVPRDGRWLPGYLLGGPATERSQHASYPSDRDDRSARGERDHWGGGLHLPSEGGNHRTSGCDFGRAAGNARSGEEPLRAYLLLGRGHQAREHVLKYVLKLCTLPDAVGLHEPLPWRNWRGISFPMRYFSVGSFSSRICIEQGRIFPHQDVQCKLARMVYARRELRRRDVNLFIQSLSNDGKSTETTVHCLRLKVREDCFSCALAGFSVLSRFEMETESQLGWRNDGCGVSQ